MTKQEFINNIAPLAQKYAKQYGYKIVSAAIAQACLESAYGTSSKAKFHNYFGLKYRPNRVNCNNGYFLDGGSEQNPDGTYTPLPSNTAWYSFEDMAHGVEGYYQFINIPNYAKVKEASTPLAYLQAIKDAHYATSLDYVQNVFNVITKWNLTQYDNIQITSQNNTTINNNINIIQKTNIHNTTEKINRNINWIVLHYTAGTASSKGSAQNIATYFAKTSNQASADFIVDDVEIVQYNPNLKNRYCWSVGGNKYSAKATSLSGQYYGQCMNNNSISIEMCSRKSNTKTLNASDDDWYITNETISNAIKLTKYLMQIYNIDINHVIMHHQVTGKWCPQPWCKNENALQNWYNFLNKINGITIQSNTTPTQTKVETPASACPYIARVTTDTLNVRSGPGTDYSIVRTVNKGSAYTIIEENGNWGLLKSYAKNKNGWISLKYIEKIK